MFAKSIFVEAGKWNPLVKRLWGFWKTSNSTLGHRFHGNANFARLSNHRVFQVGTLAILGVQRFADLKNLKNDVNFTNKNMSSILFWYKHDFDEIF